MQCNFVSESNKIISLDFDNKKNFEFDLESKSLDVSEMIAYISELDEKIEIDSTKIEEYIENDERDELHKNSFKYLKLILLAFNEAYEKVISSNLPTEIE